MRDIDMFDKHSYSNKKHFGGKSTFPPNLGRWSNQFDACACLLVGKGCGFWTF